MTIEISTAAFNTIKPLSNLHLIVATDLEGAIGRNNDLPWDKIPGDLPRFKTLTTGSILIMGRKAFASLPGLLPGRDHYVITSKAQGLRKVHHDKRNLHFFHSVEGVLSAVRREPNRTFFVAGGSEIYRQLLPYCSILYLTTLWSKVDADVYSREFKPGSPSFHYFRNVHDTFVLTKTDNEEDERISHAYRTFVRKGSVYDTFINRWKKGRAIKKFDKNFT